MKCPACSNNLTPVKAGNVTVDVCLGNCGGIWFDNFELKKFDEPHEINGELLGNISVKRPGLHIDNQKKRNCPKCQDYVMMRHFFSSCRKVVIDECPNCGGYWLDAGELAQIREECVTEQEKQKAVERYFAEVSIQQMETIRSGGQQDQIERARKLSNLFRFTTPIRYYVEA